MRFMVLVHPGNKKGYEAGQMPSPDLLQKMGRFNEELIQAGVMLSGDGLHPSSKGARVHFPENGNISVTEGPFAETSELVGGFWMWQVKSREEALAWAKRAPMEAGATLELRQVFEMADFGQDAAEHEKALAEKLQKQKRG